MKTTTKGTTMNLKTACYENDQDYMETFHHPEK